jgi:hypothetical protein
MEGVDSGIDSGQLLRQRGAFFLEQVQQFRRQSSFLKVPQIVADQRLAGPAIIFRQIAVSTLPIEPSLRAANLSEEILATSRTGKLPHLKNTIYVKYGRNKLPPASPCSSNRRVFLSGFPYGSCSSNDLGVIQLRHENLGILPFLLFLRHF